jgi:hypothetical protein
LLLQFPDGSVTPTKGTSFTANVRDITGYIGITYASLVLLFSTTIFPDFTSMQITAVSIHMKKDQTKF